MAMFDGAKSADLWQLRNDYSPAQLVWPDVMERREPGEVLEVFLLVGVAVVGAPGVPDRELVEPQHVHHSEKKETEMEWGKIGRIFETETDSLYTAKRGGIE